MLKLHNKTGHKIVFKEENGKDIHFESNEIIEVSDKIGDNLIKMFTGVVKVDKKAVQK